ncbi:uncharacterized protein LOC129729995 isoform X2 [Wyeomyia smithii]|uniref:uncharacterized protein LOC129729995 isoform X2 n=1 Tax=Wyeomyia smithii TaxID=174621 RepID=UPI002467D13B|nr:uncharacterized protein LOC129729995 isoform X2 [Wyeomyia smithii]
MVKKGSKKGSGKKKAPKISTEEQLEILRNEAEANWRAEQEALSAKEALGNKRYNQRRAVLVETIKFFRKLEKTATDVNRQLQNKTEWEQYLSCENRPNAASAADLRDFLYRWQYESAEEAQNLTSWTLDINERSVLTQNELEPVKTRKLLESENENLIHKQHLARIKQALKVLALIEDSSQHSFPHKEVLLARDEIRKKISDTLDEMTMSIGRNIWRDMKPLDSITAQFSFSSDILRFFIWSFRDVPLPPEYNHLIKVLPMNALELKFSKPISFDLKETLMRAYWTRFDHYSDHDRYFRCATLEAVPDLIISQEIEWAERNALRMTKLQSMKTAREKFEEDKKKQELEQQADAKNIGKNVKTDKTKKKKKIKTKNDATNLLPDVPPPIITEATIVDVETEYVQQEMEQYHNRMHEIGPESLNLSENMVNLRKYRITGGIYCLNRFRKLPQTVELRNDFIYSSVPSDLKLAEFQYVGKSEDELIKIEFKLPEYCFWWHEPIACSWESWEESLEFQSLDKRLQEFHLNYENIMQEQAKLLFSAPKVVKNPLKPTIIPDFNLSDIPAEIKLHYLIVDHILPRLPQNFKFHAELRNIFKTMQSKLHHGQRLRIEELLNELLYPKYLAMQASDKVQQNTSNEIFRIPSQSDVSKSKESVASLNGSLIDTNVYTPVQTLLQELASTQEAPSYLFPPTRRIPILVITEKNDAEINEQEFEELLEGLQEGVASDDDFNAESVYKLFSTFLKVLDRLREKEQPEFADVPTPEEEEEVKDSQESTRTSKDLSHRHRRSPRQPIRRMSSFLMPDRPRQRSARGSIATVRRERKQRKSVAMSASDVSTDDERESMPLITEELNLSILPHPVGSWSTKLVHKQEYDSVTKKLTIWVQQLSTFGFAMEKYYNLPFIGWDLKRCGKITELTTIITLECVGLTVAIRVTKSGYRVAFHDTLEQGIGTPTNELTLDELQQFLTQANVTIFPEPDALFYLQKMTTAKHESMEVHNLKAMAAFCLTHNFRNCFWNRYSSAREALIQCRQLIEGRQEPEFVTVMMSPQEAATVTVKELCSPLDQVLLEYCPTPENQSQSFNIITDSESIQNCS